MQMAEVRRALEAEVAALAAAAPRDLRRIRQSIDALDAVVAAGGDGVVQDVAFHREYCRRGTQPVPAGYPALPEQAAAGPPRASPAPTRRVAKTSRAVREEHERIVQAIETGDAARARQAASKHMDNAIARIEQADPAFWQQEGTVLAKP